MFGCQQVGYGDICPTTDIAKIFTIVLSVLGLGLFGAFLDVTASWSASVPPFCHCVTASLPLYVTGGGTGTVCVRARVRACVRSCVRACLPPACLCACLSVSVSHSSLVALVGTKTCRPKVSWVSPHS